MKMKPWKKVFLCALMMLSLLPCLCLAQETETVKLPIDMSGGKVPQKDGFDGWNYSDPTITVTCEKKRFIDECDYWVARIKIADASQLRTVSAGGFDSLMVLDGFRMAKRVNAVLAINGDYFSYTGKGYILRQGELYMDHPDGVHDVLQIDEDGDFHLFSAPQKGDVTDTVDGKKVINSFFFGPVLIRDGKAVRIYSSEEMATDVGRQRMCIAQTGPLEYMCICCAGPERGNYGMTLRDFQKIALQEGAVQCYNLDGGNSTMLMLNAEKINDPDNAHTRQISDIIYFASAYGE